MDFTAFLAGASLTAGRIVVLDLNGNIKILAPGQAIAPGELVIETLEETDVPQFRIATDAGETNITDDIQQIFAALEEGQDPTQLGDDFATAAGETGGSSLVAGGTISRTGAESLASTDFSTQGLQALGLNEAQSLSLFDLLNDANTALQDIDSVAPSAPTITLDTDSGSKADDFLTNDGSYTVTDIEDGATVEYFVDGEWTTTKPVAVEGENTIIIRQTDDAGNSSESSTLTFTLDTTAPDAPQISLDIDSGSLADDFLTNKGDFTVAGTEEGATVEYFVNGEWTTTAPTPVEGDNTIIVRQTDTAGNTSGSSTLTFTLDTTAPDAPQISLETDSGSLADDFLTNKGDFTVTGTEEGATVEYFVNGEWTTTAPTPVEGDNTIIVRQTDAAGNTSGSSTLTFTLDTTAPDAPQISLDTDSGSSADDLLTNKGDFTVTGTEESATVEYFVNGEWTTTAPTPVEGDNTIIVRQTDAAGNTSGSSTLTFTLDTTAQAGTVSVDPITSDDVITETEKNQTITVTGSATGGDIKTGDVVTAIINGKEYTGSVSEDGAWELSVSGSDLAVDTAFEVTVNSTDAAGNEVTSKGESVHRFDDTPINVNIDIDPITSDSVVNAQEVNSLVTVTGTVTGESFSSGVVTLTINGVEYTGEVVNGKYSIEVKGSDLSADSDNVVDAKVDVVNTAGNIGSATSTEFYLVDTFARGTIKIDSITDDNVINKAESEGLVKVTGSVGGDARPGDQVTVVVNGVTYTTSVLSNKTWEVSVSGSDLAQDDKVTATVTGDDWAGNPFSGSGERDYVVDTEIGTDGDDATKAVSIDSITEDTADATDFITSDNQLVISGSVDLAEGDSLTVNFNGTDYTTDNGLSIADGKWTLDVTGTTLADGSYDVTATVTDTAGNSDKAEQTIVVDTEIGTDGDDATKAVSIDSITEDTADATDFITSDNQLVISGSVDLAEGDSLTVNFNGTDYTTDNGLSIADGKWTLDVTGTTLADGSYDVTATVTDTAGNSDKAEQTIVVDTEIGTDGDDATKAVSIDSITEDTADATDFITSDNQLVISGSVDLAEGDSLTVNFNGTDYTTDNGLSIADGKWTLDVTGTTLADGSYDVTATVTDTAGNSDKAEQTIVVDTEIGTDGDDATKAVSIDSITEDTADATDFITSDNQLVISGSVDLAEGDSLTVNFNGTDYTTDNGLSIADGKWTLDVTGTTLADGSYDVTATVTDTAGNSDKAEQTIVVDTEIGTDGDDATKAVSIDSITEDTADATDFITSDNQLVISGSVDLAEGDSLTVNFNGTDYTTDNGLSIADGKWTLDVTGTTLADGSYDVTATVTDTAGNSDKAEQTIVVDTEIGTDGDDATKAVSIDSITEDTADATDFITSDNQLVISGSVDLAEGDSLTVNFNGTDYTTDNGLSIADGKWTLDVTGTTLADGSYDVTATVTDTAGNSDKAEQTIVVDTEIGTDGDDATKAVSIDSITEDTADATDFITSDNQLVISGSVDLAEGDSLTVNFNGTDYTTDNGLSIADGKWTLDVTGTTLADGSYDVTATVTDTAGNSDKAEQTIVVDTEIGTDGDDATKAVSIDSITEDTADATDFITSDNQLVISGSVDLAEGDSLTVNFNGTDYTTDNGLSIADGKWTLDVTGTTLADGSYDVTATVTDTAGNSDKAEQTIVVDTEIGTDGDDATKAVSIDSITEDTADATDFITSDNQLVISGSVDLAEGDSLTVNFNGTDYTTDNGLSIADGKWTLDVTGTTLADGSYDVTATVTDTAGNSDKAEQTIVVDTEIGTDGDDATKAVSIDSITEDTADATDFITSDNQLVISGSVDLAEGDSLTVNFNGTDYTTDNGLSIADGKWTLDVTGTTLADGSYDVTATVTDTAGNSDKAEQTIVVDTEIGTDGDDATKAVSIDSITEDTADATDFITSDNQLVISGSVDLAEGDSLTVNFNGTDYTTDNGLSIADGKWTLDVTGTTLADGSYDVTATVTDTAGNSDKAEQTIVVDTEIGTEIDILNIAGDHKISADESNADVTVVGYVNKDAQPNDKIDFYVNGELIGSGFVSNEPHLDAHGNQIGYKFEFVTKGSNLIPDGEVDGGAILTAKVAVSDVAGNTFVATTTEPYFFDIDAPDAPTITKVTDDSSGSDYSVVTLHGTGSEPGNEVEVFAKDANGVYVTIGTATVQQDLSWTLDISNESAIPLNDNEFLYAKEKDSFGNVSEASNTVHYYHGTYDPALAESTDDFVLLGSGDDLFKSDQDDANNKLVVDGGAGNDTAELNFASTSASVALNTDGSVTITEANGDVNTFIEFENFKFTDGTKTTSELFAPKVSLERDQDDVINSDRSTVGYTITLPVGAVVGAMLTIVIEGVTQSFALKPEHIAAGTISGSIDSGSVVGDELSISAEITYGNQPSHLEFKDSDQLAVNEGPQGNDFVVTLSPDSSVIGFDFETESTADGQQIDVVTDREDDANSTDAKEATISFDSLPVLGTVYVVNSDGSRTEVTKDTVVKVTDKLEYDLHDDVNDKLSFDAQTDFKGVYADDTVTSFVLDSGVIISGGHYTGSRPDTDSSLTPDELFFDNADNEKGLGVGSSELDVSTKDYISVDFSQISQGKTDVLVKEANVTFGSVWGNYNDTSSADAQIHVLVFKDGQVVQEFIYDDDQQPIYDGSGVFTANIKVDGGFDEIRVYTTHGTDNPNNNGNSNVTLQSVEVVDAAVSEEVVYEATDSDKGTDKGTIDFVTDSTETSTNNAPHLADTRFSEVGTEDTEISLNLGALNPTDPDGDATYISNVSVDPSYGSLVLTHDANGVVTSAVFKPAENKHFDDVPFTVTVSDGHKTDTATVMLEVKAVADAPNVTVVFGDSVTTNVTMDSTLHTKLVNGQVLSEADKAALGVTGVVVEVNRNATGTNGSEVLFGSAQADTMYGKYGNDVFVGGAGDDKIDGDDSWSTTDRDGVDTVIYSGSLSNYTLVNNGDFGGKVDQWAVFDSTGKDASARTGTSWELTGDHLYEIERLVFSDAIVTLNPDGTYHVEQITETALNLSASVADRDGSEYLDEVQIKGLPDGTMIIDKDTGETLGGFQDINGEQVWVIDVEGNSTQSINYDNLVVRTPSSEALDVDVHVVAKENSLPQSDAGASTEVNAAVSNDVLADQGGEVPTTLISLVIDSSGSMASKPTGLTESRIEYVLEASIELLKNVKSQQGSESVLVQMIDFDTDATHATNGSSSVWMTVTQAISVLNSALANVDNDNYNGIFDAEGWTNYDQGVDAVMAGYQDATVKGITGDTNDVIYFLSDGAQNQGTIGSDWAAFIKGKDVTAVGVGSEANVPSSGLIQVSGSADNIVYIPDDKLVTDLPKLRPTIGTAGSLLMSVSGDDATEVVIDATKAQVIQMIDTDSSVINIPDSLSFSVDSVSNELLVSTLYGDFRIGQDGSYYFQPDSSAPKINTGQSVAFEVLMTVKDVSGVESEQLVTLNVSPNGESNAAATSSFNASTGDDQIRGTDNNDIILGHAGNDVLDGGLGDDLLFGGAGSDLLIGGLGNDILTGGDGADIFKWVDMETARDLVTDFNASQGDKLDLADLFDDMSKADIDTLLADLGSGDNQGAVGDVSISVSDDASASHLTIVKGGQTLTIDFDGASAADITSSLMDNLNHLKD